MSDYTEVVTSAHVRPVEVGGVTGALITIDNGLDHTRPTSFGPQGLGNLDAAITAALDAAPAFIAVTGKPFIFAAGADLQGVATITDRDEVLSITRSAHRVFARLTDAPMPTIALVNGLALGGGLELALSCHYRTVSSDVTAIALPETFLGLVPGWGGAYLLPNLIGAQAALTVIIDNPLSQNRMLRAADALRLGIVDRLLPAADFIERSLEFAARLASGAEQIERPAVDRGQAWTDACAAARRTVMMRTSGAFPAPLRAIDLVEAAAAGNRQASFDAEDQASADLVMDDRLRAGLYAFNLIQRVSRKVAGAPDADAARPVTRIGVVGAGLMARQLAQVLLTRFEVPVLLTDTNPAVLADGVDWVRGQLAERAGKGRLRPEAHTRLSGLIGGVETIADLAGCDMVIEAVSERLEVKQAVFAALEQVVSDTCLLLTNTSSLSVDAMGASLAHPERLVGLHFFNPVAVMPLVEVVRSSTSDDASVATAIAIVKKLRKTAVLVADHPAFVVNRLLGRFLDEIGRAVDAGLPPEDADRLMAPLGLPMPPFVLVGLVGAAIAYHTGQSLAAAFPDRYAEPATLGRIVGAGKGAIYQWVDGRPVVDPEVAALLPPADPAAGDGLYERVLDALADEVGRMLAEGVVDSPMQIDLCMLLGAGWPLGNGGLCPLLDRSGASERILGRRLLPAGVASVAR